LHQIASAEAVVDTFIKLTITPMLGQMMFFLREKIDANRVKSF
jgi:hypothetical protein